LISVVPRHLVASTGVIESLVTKELPFKLPVVHVDMLWHERDNRNPSHKWIRAQFAALNYSQGEHFT
jgi:DNA-binding transcriptional LysR family regulator